MRSAKLYRYDLPMDSGVILRDQRLKQREGFVVELALDGEIGRGEIAPLAGFSVETMDEAYSQLVEQLALWQQGAELDFSELYPSVAFGLSMAQMELAKQLPVPGAYQAAPLCSGDPDELIPKLNAMTGEKVAKIKVGLYEPIRDGMLVSLFLESIPDLTLRLDANRAWSAEKARQFAKKIAPSLRGRISFIEEPCQVPGDSFSFAIDTGIAIAWDETLQHAIRRNDFKLEDLNGAKAIVIKPTLIGSVERCIELISRAKELGIKAVVSSSIESSLGLTQLARLAHWQLPDEVPGLDTVGLFAQQLEVSWPGCELPVASLSDQALIWQSE
ncbi:o-succinylbenzoate synthase [Vibrio brasiliensis]|uniref:o-succinylbenzoate synthase n=1 Tax=Vibrio brasiliensis TaxID=170652 RepID=UPI001EFC329E|nr:o-succinylbenzoate synthase [Vibrio brasiliensis]MCG9752935.1 o-succinylbenzoate synthase [Vibrio brasiliensis]MCG9783569.1 o-succinylbenzoate synthase [Vibrio brasiliensis]